MGTERASRCTPRKASMRCAFSSGRTEQVAYRSLPPGGDAPPCRRAPRRRRGRSDRPNVEQRRRKLGRRVLDGDRPHLETGQRRRLHWARQHQPLIGMGREGGGDPGVGQLGQVGLAAGAPRVDPDRHRTRAAVARGSEPSLGRISYPRPSRGRRGTGPSGSAALAKRTPGVAYPLTPQGVG